MKHKKKALLVLCSIVFLLVPLLFTAPPCPGQPTVDWSQGPLAVVTNSLPLGYGCHISDGVGGVIIFDEDSKGKRILKRILPDGTVAPGWEDVEQPPLFSDFIVDGEGGVWLVFVEQGTLKIVRHYLPSGKLDPNARVGKVLVRDPNMSSRSYFLRDDYGGTYFFWVRKEERGSRVVRFDKDWNRSPGWPADGVLVRVDAGTLSGSAVDELGGVFVVSKTLVNGPEAAIWAQRLDKDGTPHEGWPEGGKRIVPFAGGSLGMYVLDVTADGEGGLFILWAREWQKSGYLDYEVKAIRMNASGDVSWENALSDEEFTGNVCPDGFMLPDGFGGVFVNMDGRDWLRNDIAKTVHLDRNGGYIAGWPEAQYYGHMFADNEGGAYIVTGKFKRIDALGNTYPGWPEEGSPIAPDSPAVGVPDDPVIQTGQRTFNVAWVEGDEEDESVPRTLYAQRVTDVLPPPNFDTYLLVENPGDKEAEVTFTFMLENGMTKKVLKLLSPHSRYTLKVNDYVPFRSVSTEITSNVPVIAERAMYFDYLSTYRGGHSCSGVPEAAGTWYLAEGYTGGSFDTYLLLQNPADSPSSTKVTYMLPGGATQEQSLELAPHSRTTISVDSLPDLSSTELSIKVDSSSQVIAERAMYFDYYGRVGGHEQAGTTSPSKTYHLPEGYTGEAFDTYILTQNPGDTPSSVTYTFMKEGGGTVERKETVSPHSRYTLKVDDVEGLSAAQFSTVVASSEPVVVERAVYFDYKGQSGGHDALGAVSPSREWYLAEGYTGGSFDTYVLLENPNKKKARVKATYMLPTGETLQEDYVLAPMSRKTVKLDDVQGLSDTEVSTKLTTDEDTPIVAERAVYFSYGSGWDGGHDTMAVSAPSTTWCFAEGYTGY